MECQECGEECSAILNNFFMDAACVVTNQGNIKRKFYGECIFKPEKCTCERILLPDDNVKEKND